MTANLPRKVVKLAGREVPALEDYDKDTLKSSWKRFPSHRNWRAGTPVVWDWWTCIIR